MDDIIWQNGKTAMKVIKTEIKSLKKANLILCAIKYNMIRFGEDAKSICDYDECNVYIQDRIEDLKALKYLVDFFMYRPVYTNEEFKDVCNLIHILMSKAMILGDRCARKLIEKNAPVSHYEFLSGLPLDELEEKLNNQEKCINLPSVGNCKKVHKLRK